MIFNPVRYGGGNKTATVTITTTSPVLNVKTTYTRPDGTVAEDEEISDSTFSTIPGGLMVLRGLLNSSFTIVGAKRITTLVSSPIMYLYQVDA